MNTTSPRPWSCPVSQREQHGCSYLQGNASSLCWDIQKALMIAARLPGHNYISDLCRGTPVIRGVTAGQQIHILAGSKIFSHQRIYDFYQAVTVTTAFCVLGLNKRDVALQSYPGWFRAMQLPDRPLFSWPDGVHLLF